MTAKRVLAYGILWLFLFQLLTGFVEAIYAFGLLQTGIPPELALVVLLLAPAALLALRQSPARRSTLLLGEAALLARMLVDLNDTLGKMVLAGAGTAALLLFWPILLSYRIQDEDLGAGIEISAGLMLAVAASALLRTLGLGLDLSTAGWFQGIAWGLAILGTFLLPEILRPHPHKTASATPGRGAGSVWGLASGLMAGLVLLYFAFTAPQVLSRWTGIDNRPVLLVYALALVWPGWTLATRRSLRNLSPTILLAITALLAAAIALTAFVNQVAFPVRPDAYPLLAPVTMGIQQAPLLVALLAFPVIFLDLGAIIEAIIAARHRSGRWPLVSPSPRHFWS